MLNNFKNTIYKLLRYSEKYTQTDMVYLAKGEFWLMSGQILSSASTFLLAIAFANLLPKETYGVYKYILSVFGILAISNLRGLETPLSQAMARNYEGDFFTILKAKMKYGVLGTLSSLGIALYYYLNSNNTIAISFLIISVFLPFFEPLGIYHIYLLAKKRFRQATIYLSITQIVATLSMIAVLFITSNIFVIILIYFTSWTVLRLTFLSKTIKNNPPNKLQDHNTLSYGKHSTLINILASLIGSADSILLFHYLGAIDLAIYSFAIAPVMQFRGLFNNLPAIALPKLATRSIAEIDKIFWRRFMMLSFIGVGITIIYIFLAPLAFKIFFPKYLDSTLYSQIFAITIILTLGQSFIGPVLNSRLTIIPKKMLYLWNIPGITFIISAFILIHPLGIMGVIISRLLSSIITTVVDLFIWHKIKKLNANNTFNLTTN